MLLVNACFVVLLIKSNKFSLRRLPKGGENSEKDKESALWLFEFHTRYETTSKYNLCYYNTHKDRDTSFCLRGP